MLNNTPALPTSMEIVRQMEAVRFLIWKVWQRIVGMGRENGMWVKFWGISIQQNS
jgi:hypothetical protein